jgi:hypothetical protein
MAFVIVNPGDPIQSHQLDQVINALNGTAGGGQPVLLVALNDATNYALTVQNDDATNQRALNVLNSSGTSMVRVDSAGVTLGAPLNPTAGSIQTAALADQGVTNQKLGPDVARANLLTNGGFEIWSRGTAGFTATNTYSADRWLSGLGAGSSFSVLQRSAAANADVGSTYSLGFTYAHVAESYISQKLEDFTGISSHTVTLSIRVLTSTANAVRPFLQLTGTGAGNYFGAYHTGTGVYQTLTLSLAVPAGATAVVAGVAIDASCTAYLDNACLAIGSVPANYVPLLPADDLARCLRYYELLGTSASNDLVAAGIATVAAQWGESNYLYRAVKPVTPTVTLMGTWSVSNCAQPAIVASSVAACRLRATASGAGQFSASNIGAGNNISVEANP